MERKLCLKDCRCINYEQIRINGGNIKIVRSKVNLIEIITHENIAMRLIKIID